MIKTKKYNYVAFILAVYIILIHQLYYRDYYFDIVTCKYKLFVIVVSLCTICILFMFQYDKNHSKFALSNLSLSDFLVIGIWAINIISVVLSQNSDVALVGTSGRSSGLITISCYVAVYFIISRNLLIDEKIFLILSASSVIISIIAICQFFMVDILGFYEKLSLSQKRAYFSTLGHSNVFTSFYSIALPVTVTLYLISRVKIKRYFYFAASVVSFCGMFSAGCDSGYIILTVTFVAGLIISEKHVDILRLSFVYAIMLLFAKIMSIVNANIKSDRVMESLPAALMRNGVIYPAIAAFLIIGLAIYLIATKSHVDYDKVKKILCLSVITMIIALFILFIIFSAFLRNVNLGKLSNILRFSDSFGSYRGYIWRIVVKEYSKLTFLGKVFGIGCDTVRPYLENIYGVKMYEVTNAYYDNAHNEYLQYLLTTGCLGLGIYLWFCIRKIKMAIEMCSLNKYRLVIILAVMSYMLHALVGINQVVTTPIFILFLSMTECKIKKFAIN